MKATRWDRVNRNSGSHGAVVAEGPGSAIDCIAKEDYTNREAAAPALAELTLSAVPARTPTLREYDSTSVRQRTLAQGALAA
jgi:hypothetical protein